jgi:hypothetical protein
MELYQRSALPLLLQMRGALALHAASVGDGQRVILLGGDSRVGKSTLVHALATRGWKLWADDTSVVSREEGHWCQVALPFRSRPRTADWRPAADLAYTQATPTEEADVAAFIALRRLPSDADEQIAIRSLAGAHAFRAVASHAIDDESPSKEVTERCLELSRQIRVHEIAFVANFDRFDALVDAVGQAFHDLLIAG